MTTEKKNHEIIEKLGTSINKLNNKLTDLLKENQVLKQQNKTLQEENQEKDKQLEHVLNLEKRKFEENQRLQQQNKTLQEKNQVIDKQLETLRQRVLNLEDLYLKEIQENQRLRQQIKTLQEKNQEKDKQLEKLQQQENQKNEIQQIEKISQNLERTLKILESDDINEDVIEILKEVNKSQQNYDNDKKNEIKVVVGLEFGQTYSGFAYCHISNSKNIVTHNKWPGEVNLRTNTVLQYDDEYNNVILWGYSALSEQQNPRNRNRTKPVELFKLHLGNLQENLGPSLPVDFKKAITDYLCEFGKLIKETLKKHWAEINFFEDVLLILPVPAEYSEKDRAIMSECVYHANLIENEHSKNLQFITEPEAAAIYCVESKLHELRDLLTVEMTFMIVDCGGDTVGLTSRKLIRDEPLQFSEVTERVRDFCGSTFIDKEFIKFLRRKLGNRAIDLLIENNYDQFRYMIQQFCQRVREPFTGNNVRFHYELDISENAPALLQYVSEDDDWLIDITHDDVKKMFDPVIYKIIQLINIQLSNTQEICSVMFLIGEFSANKYLQKRIKQEFQHRVYNISVPGQPMTAITRGAVNYGLSIRSNFNNLDNLVVGGVVPLKYTYGIQDCLDWKEGDPPNRKTSDGKIFKFKPLARRGTMIKLGQTFTTTTTFKPEPWQPYIFNIFYTREYSAGYIGEPGMKMLGKLAVHFPDIANRSIVDFGLTFNKMEITAFVENRCTGQKHIRKFEHGEYDD